MTTTTQKRILMICPHCGGDTLYVAEDLSLYWDEERQEWAISDDALPRDNTTVECSDCCESSEVAEARFTPERIAEFMWSEGWGITNAGDADLGDLRLCHIDEPDNPEMPFSEDQEAWTHVLTKANEGSRIYHDALIEVCTDNPSECVAICEHAESLGIPVPGSLAATYKAAKRRIATEG